MRAGVEKNLHPLQNAAAGTGIRFNDRYSIRLILSISRYHTIRSVPAVSFCYRQWRCHIADRAVTALFIYGNFSHADRGGDNFQGNIRIRTTSLINILDVLLETVPEPYRCRFVMFINDKYNAEQIFRFGKKFDNSPVGQHPRANAS